MCRIVYFLNLHQNLISFQRTYKSYCSEMFQQQYIDNTLSKTVLTCIKRGTLQKFQ